MATTNTAEAVGYVLREARHARGLSRLSLGIRLGVSRQRVEQIEKGQACPQIETLRRFAKELGTTASSLLAAAEVQLGERL